MAGRVSEAADNLVEQVTTLRSRYQQRVNEINQQLSPRQQALFSAFHFLVVFTVLAVPFYAVLHSGWDGSPLRELHAAVSTYVLSVLGLEVSSTGSFIVGSELVLDVTRDSTGWKSVLAFTALVIAAGRPVQKTVYGIVVGIGVLFVANVVRITSMFYAVTVYNIGYELLHTVLWRWGLTAVVLVTWIGWISGCSPVYVARCTGRGLVDRAR